MFDVKASGVFEQNFFETCKNRLGIRLQNPILCVQVQILCKHVIHLIKMNVMLLFKTLNYATNALEFLTLPGVTLGPIVANLHPLSASQISMLSVVVGVE